MSSDEPKTFYAYEFAIDNLGGGWFQFEHLATGGQFEMSELEARDFCAWLKSALYGRTIPPAPSAMPSEPPNDPELALLEAYERGRSDARARCLARIKHWFGGDNIWDQGYECVREIEAAG